MGIAAAPGREVSQRPCVVAVLRQTALFYTLLLMDPLSRKRILVPVVSDKEMLQEGASFQGRQLGPPVPVRGL